ncbi:MAG: aminotransferase class V-fold PLP-dependent enzyme [Candidatus Thorarchaeota archaeon]|nr:MAG: hypothetical protein DRP09_02190 [Candidatus Thorarchaeota archaeon]RLI60095.1 MAG: hypothetical protein DRO87_00845 [Candidatus Thorarchaeota archaeon]
MPNLVDPDFVTEMWPTLAEMTYLNNASTGIPPISTINAMRKYLDDRTRAVGTFKETLENCKAIRQHLATLLGGDYHQYGFVPSTSSGVNSFAHAIDYPQGSNIVLCDLEFPANYVPWQNVSRLYDVDLRVVRSEEGAAPVDRFAEVIDENTRVVAVSQVQFASGYRIDLKRLAKVCHDQGALLSVDVIQAAGCIKTDLPEIGVDFATGQAAKWLLGPIGAGYVYVSDRIMDDLHPRFLGWWGVEDIMKFGYVNRTPLSDARKLQVGSPTMVAYLGLLESLKTLLRMPGKTRQDTAFDNADYLRKRLSEMRIPYYDYGPKNNSAIVSCVPEDLEAKHENMTKNRVHCSVRNGRLRISPHFYNNRGDIDTIIEYLG